VSVWDLLVVGRPTVDVMFSGLPEWPALDKDLDADGFGLCAGTTFNTPAAANRLGLRVAYVATLGNDALSRLILDEFESEGLPRDFVEIEDRPMPAISVALNLDGERGFVSYWGEDATYDPALDRRALAVAATIDARHVHLYADAAPELERLGRERGMTVSLDAFDGPWWVSPRPVAAVLEHTDVLFANEAEAKAMARTTDLETAVERLGALCPCVAVKRGPAGAVGIRDGMRAAVPADPVAAVDTTGAGDCFNAGFLFGWLAGLDLEASLTLGVICGTRATTDYGGYRGCPRDDEILVLAAARGVALSERGSA
jgi:sugar/nucleoside kinase (ribokinase family)